MVLAMPWYGLDFECSSNSSDAGAVCELSPLASTTAPCTDGAAHRVDLSQVFSSNESLNAVWDVTSETWFATYRTTQGTVRQLWYDDMQSLSRKFQIGRQLGLGGVAVTAIPKTHPEVQTNLLRSTWQQ